MHNKLTAERLNFVIAVCAILISAASFYATFLQARSAEQQVKAMTYPLVQFDHGNFDLLEQSEKLYFSLRNAAVGPAVIKSVDYHYENRRFDSLNAFLQACCEAEYAEYLERVKAQQVPIGSSFITGTVVDTVLPPMENQNIFTLIKTEHNKVLWQRLDRARFEAFYLDICYCSLLDQCYRSTAPTNVVEVKSCQ